MATANNASASEKKSSTKLFNKLYFTITIAIAAFVIVLNVIQASIVVSKGKDEVGKQNVDIYYELARTNSDIVTKTIEEYAAHLDFYTKADIVQTLDTPQISSSPASCPNESLVCFRPLTSAVTNTRSSGMLSLKELMSSS